MLIDFLQLSLSLNQMIVAVHSSLIYRQQQVEDLFLIRIDFKGLILKYDVDAHIATAHITDMPVCHQVIDTRHQVVVVVGFGDEIVGTGLQALDNIERVAQGGKQNYRNISVVVVGLHLFT